MNPKTQLVKELPATTRGISRFAGIVISSNSATSIIDLGCDKPMVIPVTIGDITSSTIIESRASTQFLNLGFTVKHNLPLNLKSNSDTLIIVDSREAEVPLTHSCTLNLTID